MSSATSTSVITAQAEADPAALAHLHDVQRPILLARIAQWTKGDSHWAEDILQETLLRAWSHPQARNADGRWNRGWLYTVARRIMIDNVRALLARPAEYPDDHIDEMPADTNPVDRLLDRREVREALSSLPEYQRRILHELYYQQRSIEDVAGILQIPKGTVKSRSFYALRALRAVLLDRGYKP